MSKLNKAVFMLFLLESVPAEDTPYLPHLLLDAAYLVTLANTLLAINAPLGSAT